MRPSWLRRIPLLLLGLADLALGVFLVWKGGREMLGADGPVQVMMGGVLALLGLGTCGMGLPALLCFGFAGRLERVSFSRLLLISLVIGGLPWAGVIYFS
ncbi:hypothetical protein [Archangium lipolyticum]|uniref:hypothetical protein n=1 Tax=Archangium lipolyticum TaxID=2970465 RepID=UPI002149EDFC|nr:hypothetical protein [Archangium lipolyticum]